MTLYSEVMQIISQQTSFSKMTEAVQRLLSQFQARPHVTDYPFFDVCKLFLIIILLRSIHQEWYDDLFQN